MHLDELAIAAAPGLLVAGVAWGTLRQKVKNLEGQIEKQNKVWIELNAVKERLATIETDCRWIRRTLENKT